MHHQETSAWPYTAEQVFDLVADIEQYPDFLPGWRSVRIVKREVHAIYVTQELGLALFSLPFNSVAILERPRRISITSNDSPFQRLTIDWQFQAQADNATLIELTVIAELAPGPLHAVAQHFFTDAATHLLTYFRKRADRIYNPGTESIA